VLENSTTTNLITDSKIIYHVQAMLLRDYKTHIHG